jgi:hypothetical protein
MGKGKQAPCTESPRRVLKVVAVCGRPLLGRPRAVAPRRVAQRPWRAPPFPRTCTSSWPVLSPCAARAWARASQRRRKGRVRSPLTVARCRTVVRVAARGTRNPRPPAPPDRLPGSPARPCACAWWPTRPAVRSEHAALARRPCRRRGGRRRARGAPVLSGRPRTCPPFAPHRRPSNTDPKSPKGPRPGPRGSPWQGVLQGAPAAVLAAAESTDRSAIDLGANDEW